MAFGNSMLAELLLDSAASCHMLSNWEWFFKYRDIENQYIFVGGLNRLIVVGIGFIAIYTNVTFGTNDIWLYNVLHILNLSTNLISLGLLQHAGATINGFYFGLSLFWQDYEFMWANLLS